MRSNVAADSTSECAPRNASAGMAAQLTEREPQCLNCAWRCRNAADRIADLRISSEARHAVLALVERKARESAPLLLGVLRQRQTERHLHLCSGIVPVAHRRQSSGIRLNASRAGRVDLGTDIVQHRAGEHLRPHRCHQHRHQAAERSADDDHALERQLAQQRPHVIDISAGVIVQPVGVVLRATSATLIRHDHAARGSDVLGERCKVAAVAREPVQTQQRRLACITGVVAIVELQPVAAAIEVFCKRHDAQG